jgi:quinol-cytochrome oxidoreductase complex cytochrome b subunit
MAADMAQHIPRTGASTHRNGAQRFLRSNLILHFRPPAVKKKPCFTLSWGLGGMAVTLVLLQMATGMLLKFIYVPTPVDAYASVQTIVVQVPFGRLVRNLHHWCANLLVVVLMLHMLRVFFHRCLSSSQAV